jgi:Nucleoside-diphosphate-sugar epimerases
LFLNSRIFQEDLQHISSAKLPWNRFKNKSILITGATGLIGSLIVDFLIYRNQEWHDNISVFAVGRNVKSAKRRFGNYFDRNDFNFIQQDISEPLRCNIKFDFMIHAASNAHPNVYATDPVGTMKANFFGMYHLLEYARMYKNSRILYVSSGEVYGEGSGIDSFNENFSGYVNHTNPRACYPSSKRATETLCASYHSQYQSDVVIVRPCHTYGATATESDNRVTAQFVNNILNEQDIVMKSEGLQVRSYCYVPDCVSALFTVLLCGESGQAYNIANKNSVISISKMAEMIAEIGHKKVVFELPESIEKAGYSVVTRAVLDSTKLESLGWKEQFGMHEGLERTIGILKECKSD